MPADRPLAERLAGCKASASGPCPSRRSRQVWTPGRATGRCRMPQPDGAHGRAMPVPGAGPFSGSAGCVSRRRRRPARASGATGLSGDAGPSIRPRLRGVRTRSPGPTEASHGSGRPRHSSSTIRKDPKNARQISTKREIPALAAVRILRPRPSFRRRDPARPNADGCLRPPAFPARSRGAPDRPDGGALRRREGKEAQPRRPCLGPRAFGACSLAPEPRRQHLRARPSP